MKQFVLGTWVTAKSELEARNGVVLHNNLRYRTSGGFCRLFNTYVS